MKKGGILNARLMGELTALRHRDKFVICDVGLPIPKDATTVDLALVEGIPSFMQTLKAVLNEIIVEEVVIFDVLKQYNAETEEEIRGLFKNQKLRCVPPDEFGELVNDAKLFIRTAEFKPCSNILLYSASGVPFLADPLDIICK